MSDERVRPFADFLREQAGGRTHDELSVALRDLVSAVTDTGKSGSLTLTITVKPLKESVGGALVVGDKVVVKSPTLDRKASIFFADREHNLVRDDPNQLSFEPLVEVPADPDEPRDIREAQMKEAR